MSRVLSWKLITTTEGAWEQLLESCVQAKESIDLEQYIFGEKGPIIDRITEVLKSKVKEGVRVRLLLDAVGSLFFYRSSLPRELEEAGIEIVFHRTVFPPSFKRIFPFLLRDHRKLNVFDRKEAHISGVIIHERARTWRDTTAVLTGVIAEDCSELFENAWDHARRMSPVGRMLSNEGRGDFFLAGNSFRLRDKYLYRSIVRNITTAKKTIYITTPYFALTRDLRRALSYARKRGVEIYLLLPKRSDNILADFVARFFYKRLLRRKIRIFQYTKSILHAKSICIDGRWATIGSCNLDWLSIWLNYELNVISENREFATELEAIFLEDLKESVEVTKGTKNWYGFF